MRGISKRGIRWVFTLGLAVLSFGCARWGRIPLPFRPGADVTVESLAATLDAGTKPVETLMFRARVIAGKPGIPGKRHFEATLLFEPPERLRLRAYRNNWSILIFDLMADDWGLRLWNAGDKNCYAGEYERLRRVESEWAGLDPTLLEKGVLVERTLLDELSRAESAGVRRRWRTNELRLERPGVRIRARFDRKSGRLVSLDYRPEAKALRARLTYGEMTEVEGVRLPQWVEIEHRRTRTRLRLEIVEYKVNRPFQREVFVPPWAIGVRRWLPLETLK